MTDVSHTELQKLFDANSEPPAPPELPPTFVPDAMARGRLLRARRRRTLQALGAGGVAAVAALAIAGTTAFTGGTAPGRSPGAAASTTAAGRPTTASAVLDRASLAAYDRHVSVRPDQYIYLAKVGTFREPTPDADGPALHGDADSNLRGVETEVVTVRSKSWTRADGTRGWAWNSAKMKPGTKVSTAAVRRPSIDEPTYTYLQSLPTDPAALLTRIRTAANDRAAQKPGQRHRADYMTVEAIVGLLDVGVLPDRLAGALYTDMGRVHGITVTPDVTDAAGRHGIGVAISDPDSHLRMTIIFDPKTYDFLGFQTDDGTGRFLERSATLDRAVVDRVG